MNLYLPPFLTSFFLTAGFLWITTVVLRRLSVQPLNRFQRLGGLGMALAFLAGLWLDRHLVMTSEMWAMMAGLGMILAVGLWDDLHTLSWRSQLLLQVAIAVVLFALGIRLESVTMPWNTVVWLHPETLLWPSLLLSVAWIVLIMNALNWTDGVDGLLGSVACIAFAVIFGLSLLPEVNQPPVAILSMILAGAVLGFLVFNFPPARLTAGTTGSLFLGCMLATLSIFAGTKMATALLILALPVADAVWVVGERLRAGVSIFQGDTTRHLHYKLRRLGWSDRQIVFFYAAVTGVIGIAALNTRNLGKLFTIGVVFGIVFGVLWWVERKTKLIAKPSQ